MTDKLKKADLLTTPARQILFDSMMQGFNVQESAKKAKIGYAYARKVCSGSGRYGTTDVNINALIKQEMAIISNKAAESLKITKERQLKEYERIKDKAEQASDYVAVRGCLDSQTRIIGGFAADNEQQQGLTLVEMVAIAAGRKSQRPILEAKTGETAVIEGEQDE